MASCVRCAGQEIRGVGFFSSPHFPHFRKKAVSVTRRRAERQDAKESHTKSSSSAAMLHVLPVLHVPVAS